jgi:hypothetical protein
MRAAKEKRGSGNDQGDESRRRFLRALPGRKRLCKIGKLVPAGANIHARKNGEMGGGQSEVRRARSRHRAKWLQDGLSVAAQSGLPVHAAQLPAGFDDRAHEFLRVGQLAGHAAGNVFVRLHRGDGTRNPSALDTNTTMSPYNVGGVRASTSATAQQSAAFSGGALEPGLFKLPVGDALAQITASAPLREIELLRFDGKPYLLCWAAPDASWLVAADAPSEARTHFNQSALLAKAQRAVPHARDARIAIELRIIESRALQANSGFA